MLLTQNKVHWMDPTQYAAAGHGSTKSAAVTASEQTAVSSVGSGDEDSTAGSDNEKDHGEKQSNVSSPSKTDLSSSSMTATAAATPVYVTELGCHDVLLGRGTGPCSHEGNVKFRDVIETMRPLYVATPSRKAKTKVVLKTVQSIKAKNGRFLRKVNQRKMTSKHRLMPQHLQLKKDVYEVVPDEVAFEKTKQAIRYVHYRKDADGKQLLEKTNGGGKDHQHHHPDMNHNMMSDISPSITRRNGEDPPTRSALFASFSPGGGLTSTPLLGQSPFSSSSSPITVAPTREQPGSGIRNIPGLTSTALEDPSHMFLPRPSLTGGSSSGSALDPNAASLTLPSSTSTAGVGGSSSSATRNAVLQQLLDGAGGGATRMGSHQPPSLSSTIANAIVQHQQQEEAARRVAARHDAAIQSLLHQHQEANANHHIQQAKHHLEQAVLQKSLLTPAPAPRYPPPPPVGADLLGSLLLGRSPSTSLSGPQQHLSPVPPSATVAGLDGVNRSPPPTAGDGRPAPPPAAGPDRGSNGGSQAAVGGQGGAGGANMARPDSVLLQHAIEDPTIRSLLMADDKCRQIIESYSKN